MDTTTYEGSTAVLDKERARLLGYMSSVEFFEQYAREFPGARTSPEQDYAVDARTLLEELGLKKIRQSGGQLSACCPLHDDRTPSFSMKIKSTQWTCHAGCGDGNGATLVARVLDLRKRNGEPDTTQAHHRLVQGVVHEPVTVKPSKKWNPEQGWEVYVRKNPDRSSGSISSIESRAPRALELIRMTLATSMTRLEARKALQDEFGISKWTANRDLNEAEGRNKGSISKDAQGYRAGRRRRFAFNQTRCSMDMRQYPVQMVPASPSTEYTRENLHRSVHRSSSEASVDAPESLADRLAERHSDIASGGPLRTRERLSHEPSEKQCWLLANLAKELGVPVPPARTKRDASRAIGRLKALQESGVYRA
jgi:CHC2 zinc finger